eukprot:TRINITY_DN2773_c0_g1_i1.p1 TRINITY_DN2773_c0_g1~~TRINITY_DN2773_c0_g1_i1.p1  ORF type:complete len:135 (-),score=10.60 TRINITY_DN2773_c0_g1_i1:87-491(-)
MRFSAFLAFFAFFALCIESGYSIDLRAQNSEASLAETVACTELEPDARGNSAFNQILNLVKNYANGANVAYTAYTQKVISTGMTYWFRVKVFKGTTTTINYWEHVKGTITSTGSAPRMDNVITNGITSTTPLQC